jgi:lipopolysaccharide transport system ATP-binding protein
MFDQRGCGKSKPFGKLEHNTTWDLVSDINTLRELFQLERWFVSGRSWGTTLALLYAETYPERVSGLLLEAVCLQDEASQQWKTSFTALKEINFTIREGETVGFVGRNGAGKSTLLGLIAGVLKPTHGTVDVRRRVSPLLELGGGFHPELSGVENIQLNGVLLGLSRKQVRDKIDQIVEFSELNEFIHQPIRMYSSGMAARLGFSVVAHLEPELLLIDEVLAVGDFNFQAKCLKKMKEFKSITQFTKIFLVTNKRQLNAKM